MAWTNVTIRKVANAFDEPIYNVVTLDGFVCRSEISGYKAACNIATAIDATMEYEAQHGAGSLDAS